jgi:dihydrofolate synthase/folylpolyglutamate synthase
MTMRSKSSVLSYLYGLQKFGIKLGLRNIDLLLGTVGHPEHAFPSVHIAGTNGKGSTSAMIAAMLRAAGFTVGLYTSPHLVDFNERIRINGRPITDATLVRYAALLRPAIDELNGTFFEATTAIAFKHFADRRVDIAVIETGLGGRLDATNVLTPLVSVITTIGKDHTEILGSTIAKIAREKAGIIKPGVPCVMGIVPPAAKKVLCARAEVNSSPIIAVENIIVDEQAEGLLTFTTPARRYASIELSLKGNFQRANAAAAIAAIEVIHAKGFPVSPSALREGLRRVHHFTGIEARLQVITRHPMLICDVAHNPAAVDVLASAIGGIPHAKLHVVMGVMKDKDYRGMIERLVSLHPEFYAVQASIARSLSAGDMAEAITDGGGSVSQYATIAAALRATRRAAAADDLILVTGSHYVVGEAMAVLKRAGRNKI